MTVVFIKEAKSKGYLRLLIESDGEKTALTVSEAEYQEAGSPAVRENLTRDSYEILLLADMRYRAKLKALNILSYGDNSERMLMRKLRGAGIKPYVVEEVTQEMVSLGYINSQRQIERLVINEVKLHNYGPLKIIPKLVAKGYDKSEIKDAISSLSERGEIDFEEARERLINSRLPSDASEEEMKKLLYKNGYHVC